MFKTQWKRTLKLWLFTFFNIPLIMWLRPRIMEQDIQRCTIMIKLFRRSKNHVRSMYFAAICTGADLAPGLLAMEAIKQQKTKCSFVFKDITGSFLKRVEANAYFTCNDGQLITDTVKKAVATKERQNVTLNIVVTTPDISGNEPMAEFKLTISIKARS